MSSNMSIRSSPATPRSKLRSVRGGENGHMPSHPERMPPSVGSPKSTERKSPRPPSSLEKRPSFRKGTELQQALEELAKVKEQVSALEKAKAEALEELAQAKKNDEELSMKLSNASEASKKERLRADEMEQASFSAAEDWQVELESTRLKYETEVKELHTTKQAVQNLKHELISAMAAKDEAVRLAGEAMTAAETTAKRAEELSVELKVARDSLTAKKNASLTAEELMKEMVSVKESAALRVDELLTELCSVKASLAETQAEHENFVRECNAKLLAKEAEVRDTVEAVERAREENESLKKAFSAAKSSELESSKMSSTIEGLRLELAAAKDDVSKMSEAVAEAMNNVGMKTGELEDAKRALSGANAYLETTLAELQEVRKKFEISKEENMSLTASIADLKLELEMSQSELDERDDTEKLLSSKVSALNVELGIVRGELSEALVSEKEAREAVEGLQSALEKAKADVEALGIKALEVRSEVEAERKASMEAEAEMEILKEKLRMAMCEAEAADKKSEEAMEEVRVLRDRCEAASSDANSAKVDAELARSEALSARKEAAEKAREAESARLEVQIALSKAELARLEFEKAKEAALMGRANADVARAEAEVERVRAKEARAEALAARKEAELAATLVRKEREEANAACNEAEEHKEVAMAARKEIEELRLQARALEESINKAHIEAVSHKEQADEIKSQLAVMQSESAELRAQLDQFHLTAKKATAETEITEEKLQNALVELEAMKALLKQSKSNGELSESFERADLRDVVKSSTITHKEHVNEISLLNVVRSESLDEFQDEVTEGKLQNALVELEAMKTLLKQSQTNGELSEPFEGVESRHILSAPQEEELKSLIAKLKETEERALMAIAEADAAKQSKDELVKSLETTGADLAGIKLAGVKSQQERERLQREKVSMQAELDRLRAEKEEWQRYASPPDSEANFTNAQSRIATEDVSPCHEKTGQLPKEAEEYRLVDVPSPPVPQHNHKKKALLLKVGTFLGKKKSHRTLEKEARENHSS